MLRVLQIYLAIALAACALPAKVFAGGGGAPPPSIAYVYGSPNPGVPNGYGLITAPAAPLNMTNGSSGNADLFYVMSGNYQNTSGGAAVVTNSGNYIWINPGATLSSGSFTIYAAGPTLSVDNNGTISSQLYAIYAPGSSITYNNLGNAFLQGSALVGDNSTITFSGSGSGAPATNANFGGGNNLTFSITGGSNQNIVGSINALAGSQLLIPGAGDLAGSVTFGANSKVQMNGPGGFINGSVTLGATSLVDLPNGDGITGAVTTGANSIINISNSGSIGGAINGSGSTALNIGVAGAKTFTTGSNISGIGNTIIYSGSTITTNGGFASSGSIQTQNNARFNAYSNLGAASIDNSGTFDFNGANTQNISGSVINTNLYFLNGPTQTVGTTFINNSSFVMLNGSLSGGTTFANNSGVAMSGGTLTNFSGGISNAGTWTMTGGTIGGGAATVAFTNNAGGIFSMSSGLIQTTGTLTNNAGSAGRSFTISGGSINKGGAIVNSGSFNMSGGSITGASSFTNNNTGSSLNGFNMTGGSYSLTGFFRNEVGGLVTVTNIVFSPANPVGNLSYNKGLIIINNGATYNQPANQSGGTYITTGTVTLNGTGKIGSAYSSSSVTNLNGVGSGGVSIAGAFSGLPGSILNIGNATPAGVQATYILSAEIDKVESINVVNPASVPAINSSLQTNKFPISNVKTQFSIASGTFASLNAAVSGVFPITAVFNVGGTLNIAAGAIITNFTEINVLNSGVVNVNTNAAVPGIPINSAAAVTASTLNVTPGGGNTYTTTNTINNIRTIGVLNGTFAVDNPITGVNTGFNIASGAVANLRNNVSGNGTVNVTGTGELRFSSGGSVSSFSIINVTTNGVITVNRGDTPAPTVIPMPILGATSNTGTLLTINPGAGNTFSTTNAITDIRTINVASGTYAMAGAVSGVTAFNVASGATATLTNTLAGTGTGIITLNPTVGGGPTILNFNTGSSISGFTALNVNSNSTININRGGSPIIPIAITGVGLNTATTVVINPGVGGTFSPAASFTNIRTVTAASGQTNITVPLTGIDIAFNVSSGARVTLTNTLNGTGAINLNTTGGIGAIMDFNTNAALTGIFTSFNVATGSTINVNGTANIPMVITGVPSNTNTTLNLNPDSVYSNAFAINDIRNINLIRGVFNINTQVTGVNTQLLITSGTVNVNAKLTGTGVIANKDTISFNLANDVAPANFQGFSAINVGSGGNVNINANMTLPTSGTNIVGDANNLNTFLYINNASTLDTANKIQDIRSIIIGDGSSLALSVGAIVSGFNDFNISTLTSTLVINAGAQFSVGPGDNIFGDGSIDNSGILTINGSNLVLGGSFYNHTSGVFKINGTPTLTFNGPQFTNEGEMVITFSEQNTLPTVNIRNVTAPNLANGVIVIGYNHNFIAAGTYSFLATGDLSGPPALGGLVKPEPSTYISSWDLDTVLTPLGYDVVVRVKRTGFGAVATDPSAKLVGNYLELLGQGSNLSTAMLALLNKLEAIDNINELNNALLDLVSPEYLAIQSLFMSQLVLNTVQGRIAQSRLGYSSGDIDRESGMWIRPFKTSGTQKAKGTLLGFNARTNGFAFGVDSQLTPWVTLGAGGSVSTAKVTDRINYQNETTIKSYQALIYGTFESKSYAYLDWALSTGVNRYSGIRTIRAIDTTILSKYSGQQLSLKTIASKNYIWQKYYQITPLASAQYTFLRQLAYRETDGGEFSRIVNPNNVNLLQLGVGGQFSIPFAQDKVTSIPEFHIMFLVDAKGGEQDNNSQFVSGGPIFSTTVKPGRLATRIGASYSFALNDSVQVVANYDFEARRQYYSNEFYINLKYVF